MKCENPDCDTAKPIFSRGLCQSCYNRQRRRGTLERKYTPGGGDGPCRIDGCDRLSHARQLCTKHYQQSFHPIRNIWKMIRSRYPGQYPGSWGDFEAFLADVGERPSAKHQLRRANSNAPWSAENARWKEPVRVNGKTGVTANMADYQRAYSYLRKFGLREEDIQRMRAEQGEKCPVCDSPLEAKHPDTGKVIRVVLDHDHRTGAVRGMLHDHCNKAMGFFDDDPILLRKAAAYLESHAERDRS